MNLEVSEPLLLLKRILNKIGRPYGINPFPRAFELHVSNDTNNCSSIFNKIYENNLWGSSQSRSGPGSEINFTSQYRTELSTLLRERNIRSVFDAPCGDLTWMYEIIMGHQLTYTGGDISHSLVDNLKKKIQNWIFAILTFVKILFLTQKFGTVVIVFFIYPLRT